MKQKIEIELDIPEGREIERITNSYPSTNADHVYAACYAILRPVERWRRAEPNDLLGGPFEGRVRDDDTDEWQFKRIVAYSTVQGTLPWVEEHLTEWAYAEIRDKGEA